MFPEISPTTRITWTCSECIVCLLACFSFLSLFCSLNSWSRTTVPRSSYELLKTAQHLTCLPSASTLSRMAVNQVLVYRGTGAQWTSFRRYQLPCLEGRQALVVFQTLGSQQTCTLPSCQANQLPSASSRVESKETSITWPASILVSKLHLSVHCLGYSEPFLLTLHGNLGTKGQLRRV